MRYSILKHKPHKKVDPKVPLPGAMVTIKEPCDVENWHGTKKQPIIISLEITGGRNCAKFSSCSWLDIAGSCANPAGPNDPYGHNLQISDSSQVYVHDFQGACEEPAGDGISVFQSDHIDLERVTITGPRATGGWVLPDGSIETDEAAAVCFDQGSRECSLKDSTLSGFGKVGVSVADWDEAGHEISGNTITGATSSCVQIQPGAGCKNIRTNIRVTSNKFGTTGQTVYVAPEVVGVFKAKNKRLPSV